MKSSWIYKNFNDCLIKVPKQKSIKSKYYRETGRYPIVSQESNLVSGYIDDKSLLYRHNKPVVIFGDHTKNIKFIDFDFVVGADGVHILLTKDDILPKFFYYELCSIKLRSLGYARHYKLLKESIIKFPKSISEQQHIVSFLDAIFAKIDFLKTNAEKQLQAANDLFQAALKELMTPKEGWVEKKLGEICVIERGGSPRPIKDYITNDSDGLNWIKIGDTDPQGKYICSTKEKIKPAGLLKSRWVEVGDFLLSNSMSFGRPYILKTNGCIHDGWLVLRKFQHYLNADFFYYMLLSSCVQKQFERKAQGSTVSNLNTQRVSAVEVYFPPLSEQQQIADKLDELSDKVKALQSVYTETITLCDDLKKALLKKVFE